jgi:putative FmdB family regulatory protein
MPTYEYRCDACGHEMEAFQSIKANPLKKCPSCAKSKLQRLISGGGAVLFKGSGFYETDYRSTDYKKKAEADKKASSPAGESSGDSSKKTDAKPAKTTETKSGGAKSDAKPAKASSK